jgi:dienelactone hydrolase
MTLMFERVALADEPSGRVDLLFRRWDHPRPVILMLGEIDPGNPPAWSTGLLDDGYLLAAFKIDHPLDPDPERRAVWLCFDERFAHSYVAGGAVAPADAARVIDLLTTRPDVDPEKIGWLGSSSSAIPGLSVAAREPRLAAIVAFVAAGAYRTWLDTWRPNGLWSGGEAGLWPETEALLATDDPIHHVAGLFPTAVLMVSGGADAVVDPRSATDFVDAARPHYEADPDRLRLVLYHGLGHNLPADIVRLYAEHWFHLYLHPVDPPPPPAVAPVDLHESVVRTQVNAADHAEVTGSVRRRSSRRR